MRRSKVLVLAWLTLVATLGCDARSTAGAPVSAQPGSSTSSLASASGTAPSPPPPSSQRVAAGIAYRLVHTSGAEASAELPLIIAIHGLGDRPDRFALLDDYPAPARVVYPRGLSPHGTGYSWFDIDTAKATAPGAETVTGVAAAADALARMIDELTRRHPTRGKPVVTGFSQGGMLSFALAARHPSLLAGAIPIAGYLPRPMWPEAAPTTSAPIVALHGAADPLIEVSAARDTVAGLRDLGFRAELVEYPGVPHAVSPAMMRELHRRLLALAP